MEGGAWIAAAAVLAMCFAVAFGPVRLTCRAVLRKVMPPDAMRGWQYPVTHGLQAGLVLTVVFAALLGGPDAAVLAAVVGLLVLLAVLDLAWRWLPFVWTILLLALGVVVAWATDSWAHAASGAAIGGGILLGLQLFFRFWRGVEALGTGDIWLAAGLGALTGPQQISLILGIAAITGLTAEVLGKILRSGSDRRRMGVAYGAHMCAAYIIVFPF